MPQWLRQDGNIMDDVQAVQHACCPQDYSGDVLAAMEAGTLLFEDFSTEDPQVVFAVRMPRSLLRKVRAEAAVQDVSTGEMLRRLLIAGLGR